MTATVEKTVRSAAMKVFDAWYEEREREQARGGKPLTHEEVMDKVHALDVEDELIADAIAWARQGGGGVSRAV